MRHRLGAGGWYEEWVGGPLVNAAERGRHRARQDADPEQVREPEDYAGQVAALKAQDLFVSAGIGNPYLMAWNLRGMDNLLADYLIHRDMIEALYDRLYPLYGEMTRRMARAGVDMISVTGDIAMQDRIIMGPKTWREVDKPRMAKLIDDCRAINPDVFFYIHSDGNVMDLMDDIVEIGFNVINPIQPECMDPVEVKRRWGDRIALHGGISLQRTLPNGTPGRGAPRSRGADPQVRLQRRAGGLPLERDPARHDGREHHRLLPCRARLRRRLPWWQARMREFTAERHREGRARGRTERPTTFSAFSAASAVKVSRAIWR